MSREVETGQKVEVFKTGVEAARIVWEAMTTRKEVVRSNMEATEATYESNWISKEIQELIRSKLIFNLQDYFMLKRCNEAMAPGGLWPRAGYGLGRAMALG